MVSLGQTHESPYRISMFSRLSHLRLRYGMPFAQQFTLLAVLPLIIAVAVIAGVVANQSNILAAREVRALEAQILNAKRDELSNYVSIARSAFENFYARKATSDSRAKLEVTRLLAAMLVDQDSYFFVFDYDGQNLVASRTSGLMGRNRLGFRSDEAPEITQKLIEIAQSGGGYHSFKWPRPVTGEMGEMVVYVNGLQEWGWVVGTGVFLNDIKTQIASAEAEIAGRITRTSFYILTIATAALLAVFGSGLFLNLRERRVTDAKLKQLTQRIVDTQEEERGRVARELHDSISQMLVGVRYALELARRRLSLGDERASESLDKGISSLGSAIQEVRRISRDLRPGVLDDLGLGPAIQALIEEFESRTGIKSDFETVVFRGRLDREGRIALYRIAQEALTNIDRHSEATAINISLRGTRNGALMRISDNGKGMEWPQPAKATGGLGMRNMQERLEQLGGTLKVKSEPGGGTTIEALVPLSHMLAPDNRAKDKA